MVVWARSLSRAALAFSEWAAALFFAALVVLVIVLVILRYAFSTSIPGGDELVEYLFIYTSALGAAALVGKRQHVAIPTFWKRMGPWTRRAFDTVNHVLVMVLNGYMVALSRTWIAGVGHNLSYMLHLPMWVIQIGLPVGCGLSMLYCLCNIVENFTADRGKERA